MDEVYTTKSDESQSLYLEEGLLAVDKPLGWTSQDVVGKIRHVLETDARDVRKVPDPRKKKRKPWMKVGHGGTLDPLATGVLVVGVGSGTKQLQQYLTGSKKYEAEVTLGYQTTTLDADPSGDIVARQSFDHVTSYDHINMVLQTKFTGIIQQIPPAFSALKRDGKKLYELAREGQNAEDLNIQPREVTIYNLELVVPHDDTKKEKPIETFSIRVECGGGTYIRSLVRDIGLQLGTVATMTKLQRTKQGSFLPEHCVPYTLTNNYNVQTSLADATATTDEKEQNDKYNIDKRKACNWTINTINDGIISSRQRLLSPPQQLNKEDDHELTK